MAHSRHAELAEWSHRSPFTKSTTRSSERIRDVPEPEGGKLQAELRLLSPSYRGTDQIWGADSALSVQVALKGSLGTS